MAITSNSVLTEAVTEDSISVNMTGLILHLQRFSTEDGPGIRTTVFFKGCPLHCLWCQNPESISKKVQVQWLENRCIGCGTCIETCPLDCIVRTEEGISIDRDICNGCGLCAKECPANAMELLGTKVDVNSLVIELEKDLTYFQQSGGGVTLSGGEPTMQTDFAVELFKRLKAKGVSTAVDTSGFCSTDSLDRILPHTDIVLFDLKEFDPEKHYHFTGQHNQKIFNNLLYISDYISKYPQKILWIRTPLIPGATDTAENITALGAFIAKNLEETVQRWELCAFNNLCRDKYRRLGISWNFGSTLLMSKHELQILEACAKSSGVNPEIVIATGITRD